MSRQEQVEKIANFLFDLDALQCFNEEDYWNKIAEALVKHGIGSKGRFYVKHTTCGSHGKYLEADSIEPIDYKEEQ